MKRQMGSFFYRPKKNQADITKKRWNILAILSKIVKRTCMTLGGFMLFLIVTSILLGVLVGGKTKTVSMPKNMVLVYNITDGIGETSISPSFSDPFALPSLNVKNIVDTLDHAARDNRVRGMIVSLDNANIELVHIQELRAAIKRFREAGKFAHIYTASFSDLGSGIGAYYFASAFEQIWMQPVGLVTLSGLSMEMPFAKDLLDKVGVNPEFLHREDYKSAMESFTNTSMSVENREMMISVLNDFSSQIINDIVSDKKISKAQFQSFMNVGIVTGDDALKAGLITHLDYADNLVKSIEDEKKKKLSLVAIEDYFDITVSTSRLSYAADVALVNIDGEIISGDDYQSGYATADYISSAIFDAAEDDAIKVIVLRVNSPGGSPTASETIRRAVVYAKEKGKRVVVSMGPLAASGGYWVAVDADKIFAMPATLTGSIGVIMGKFELSGLWKKLGVNWDGVSWGDNAGLWSMNKPLSSSEKRALNYAIDDMYDAFLTRVAVGRNIPKEKVRDIAKGRVWTGEQAQKNGLVDTIGGLDDAMDEAARIVGVNSRADLNVIIMPKPLTPIEQFITLIEGQVSMGRFDFGANTDFFKFWRKFETIQKSGPIQAYDPDLNYVR